MRRVKDLTLRWVLPKQEYMERALKIWKQEELPPLDAQKSLVRIRLGFVERGRRRNGGGDRKRRAGQKRTATEG